MNSDQDHAAKKLRQEIDGLISRFLTGKEPDFLRRHARMIDAYFHQSFESSSVGPRMGIEKNPYAVIALGGYGRQEQCIHSDVDLLFLFARKVPTEAEALIQEMVYPLWDIGLDVGYAIRSLKECLSLAARQFDVLTPVLDARFICGISSLYTELMGELRKQVITRQSRAIIDWLVETNQARHLRFGDSAYLLEPNLKEGQGGLRDYHTMLWISRVLFNLKQPRDLEYFGRLSHDEYQALTRSLEFIWLVRNRLHFICGRKCDQLHYENQARLAAALNFKKADGQQPVERFLATLHGQMEYLKQQFLMFLYELGLEKKRRRRRKTRKQSGVPGLRVIAGGMLNFERPEKILKSPQLLMEIFAESARLGIPLSAEALRLVREFAYLLDNNLRDSAEVVRSFERILLAPAPTFNALNEMLNTGLLQQFIPEFSPIVNRIQYDEYHLYPVDKHCLRTVQTIKKFAGAENKRLEPLCATIYRELGNKKPLFWAALLHDIGKGRATKNHSEIGAAVARTLLQQKELKAGTVDAVDFLVREHLFLIKSATRRDINDEETAIFCARRIRNIEWLKMLYLLTVADSVSTGPAAWNDWTATLLRDFFLKILNILEKGELASRQAVEMIEGKKTEVIASAPGRRAGDDLEALFTAMSPRYLLYTSASEILDHIGLYQRLGGADFIWDIHRPADINTRRVTVCAKDRPGLISKIAGVFTLNSIDILDVQVFTWRNQIALDIFTVKPPPDQILEPEKWKRAEDNLKAALADSFDLAAALKKKISRFRAAGPRLSSRPDRIEVDNTGSSFFTIVEVFAYDFPGLLFSITDALFHCGLSIWLAKIATKVDQVVDVFYVRDVNGQKVDTPEQVAEIKAAIRDSLPSFGPQN
jgi:[protein-PII] uridylyltransferase